MTYNVFVGMLSLTQSINQSYLAGVPVKVSVRRGTGKPTFHQSSSCLVEHPRHGEVSTAPVSPSSVTIIGDIESIKVGTRYDTQHPACGVVV